MSHEYKYKDLNAWTQAELDWLDEQREFDGWFQYGAGAFKVPSNYIMPDIKWTADCKTMLLIPPQNYMSTTAKPGDTLEIDWGDSDAVQKALEEYRASKKNKCTCGAAKCGTEIHSDWCDRAK